jgi:hypothetical protein
VDGSAGGVPGLEWAAWRDLDDLIADIKDAAVADDGLPESAALIFHEGLLSGVLATPPFVVENADEVARMLCRFLPQLQADQIAVVWPARYVDDQGEIFAMKILLWERSSRHRAICRIVPLPIHGSPDGAPVELPPPDPWSRRVARALARPPCGIPGIVDVRLPAGYDLMVHPHRALGRMVPLHAEN